MRALAPRPPGVGVGVKAVLKQLWAVETECSGFSCQQESRGRTSIPVPGNCHGWSCILAFGSLCRYHKICSQIRRVLETQPRAWPEQFPARFAAGLPVMMKVSHLSTRMLSGCQERLAANLRPTGDLGAWAELCGGSGTLPGAGQEQIHPWDRAVTGDGLRAGFRAGFEAGIPSCSVEGCCERNTAELSVPRDGREPWECPEIPGKILIFCPKIQRGPQRLGEQGDPTWAHPG